ncbi:histidine phosphatase family protein [Dongia sp.]|uniref:histidine phosphatase family protein n=1 Tax=Dongia sp. TaxID=1977262 RepID=UPI0035B3BE1D
MRSTSIWVRRCLPRTWQIALLRSIAGIAGVLALACAAMAIDEELDEAQAIRALQEGGHIVYLRHAARSGGPRENLDRWSSAAQFADCSHQRNLTPEGQDQARQLGDFWRRLHIPVERVIASAQCRTRDTAILAFGAAETDPRLFDLDFVRRLLAEPAPAGKNRIVVGSDAQLRELTGVELGYAEAALVKGDGKGGISVVARLELDDWADAAEPGWW